jgi:dolichyl-phosphate beta-glucosyltransferase
MSLPKYSIVIPALEEEAFIGHTLDSIHQYLTAKNIYAKTEIVVVTATSKDKTAKIVKSHQHLFKYFQFIEPGHRVGKGRDVKAGILAARGQYLLFMDADLSTPVHHILPALKQLETGHDMVIGERDLADIHTGIRKAVSLGANTLSRMLIARRFKDTQCGFKGFTSQSAGLIFNQLTIEGWSFDMEVLTIAVQNNLKITSIPVRDWRENKPEDKQLSGEGNLRATIKSLRETSKISKNKLKGRYRPQKNR